MDLPGDASPLVLLHPVGAAQQVAHLGCLPLAVVPVLLETGNLGVDLVGHLGESLAERPDLPAAERDDLFRRFRRTSVLPTEGESSTGLGLWIAKTFIQLHGGTLRLDDEGDEGVARAHGATFVIEIPAAPPAAEVGLHEEGR